MNRILKLLTGVAVAVFLCLAAAALVTVLVLQLNWSLAVLLVFCIYIVENLVVALFRRRK